MHVTTRIEGRKNDELLFDLGENSFPTILFLNESGEVVARHRELNTQAEFGIALAKVQRAQELEKKAKGGDKAAAVDLMLLRCELHAMDLADLEEKVDEGLKLTELQRKAYGNLAAEVEVAETIPLIQRNRYRPAILADSGEAFVEHFKKGAVPPGRLNAFHYWLAIGYYAWDGKDQKLLDQCLFALKPPAGHEFYKSLVEDLKKKRESSR